MYHIFIWIYTHFSQGQSSGDYWWCFIICWSASLALPLDILNRGWGSFRIRMRNKKDDTPLFFINYNRFYGSSNVWEPQILAIRWERRTHMVRTPIDPQISTMFRSGSHIGMSHNRIFYLQWCADWRSETTQSTATQHVSEAFSFAFLLPALLA